MIALSAQAQSVDPRTIEAYRSAARAQAEIEVDARNSGSAARKTWIYCIANIVPKLAHSPDNSAVVMRAAFGACAAQEQMTVQKWAATGGPSLAEKYRVEERRDLTNRFLPLIVKFKARGFKDDPTTH